MNGLPVIDQLLASPHPSIVYKTRTLLLDENPASPKLVKLKASVKNSKMARALLMQQGADGRIPTHPYRKWQGPHWTLYQLALIAYPPGDAALLPLRDQIYDYLLEEKHLHFPQSVLYPGQEERFRRCASQEGNAIWYSILLGLDDDRTRELVTRLVKWQWPDGGWNCDKKPEAATSSVIESLIPLRALSVAWKTYRDKNARAAAERAADFFLSRRLLFRKRDGALIMPRALKIQYPIQWYDVLFVLTVMAEAGKLADPRCREAVDLLERKMLSGGAFPLESRNAVCASSVTTRGTFADWGPSRKARGNDFVTVEALAVLKQAGRLSLASS